MYLLLYLYAIAGIIFFADNDPWNFQFIETTMLVLLRYDRSVYLYIYFLSLSLSLSLSLFSPIFLHTHRVVSLDTWGDNFYTNYYGCSHFPGGVGQPVYTENESEVDDRYDPNPNLSL